MVKTLFIISTPIGNLADFSERAISSLNECDAVFCEDARTSLKLLNHFKIKKPLIKYEKYTEQEISNNIEYYFNKYNKIGLITDAGTPCISDPGAILVEVTRRLGYNIVAIPGCCALVYAISTSGFTNNNFVFLGFLPRNNSEQIKLFKSLENNSENLNCFVFYESPLRILNTLNNLNNITTEQIFIVNDATKLFEKQYSGSLKTIITQLESNENYKKGEYVVVFTLAKSTQKKETALCLESLLLNEIITKRITTKEAIKNLSASYSKNDLYKASLNLKNINL